MIFDSTPTLHIFSLVESLQQTVARIGVLMPHCTAPNPHPVGSMNVHKYFRVIQILLMTSQTEKGRTSGDYTFVVSRAIDYSKFK